ncbi:MAG TPA: hypothetical protein VGG68_02180 [Caulobacteraceae bacterium]|jgi:hypothetical protein
MNAVFSWFLEVSVLALALTLFLILTAACEIGYLLGRRRGARVDPDDHEHRVTSNLTSGMAALLAFILGLSVNYAQGRFETRRDLVVTEANAISVAWLRARLVGGEEGNEIADLIGQYAQTRLEFTTADTKAPLDAINARASEEQEAIWRLATEVSRKAPTPIVATLVTGLNQMFDEARAQRFAFIGESPGAMLEMLLGASAIAIGAMGFEMGLRGHRQVVLTTLLLIMWSGAMVVAVDFNRPRVGLVRIDPKPLEWTLHEIRSAPPPQP